MTAARSLRAQSHSPAAGTAPRLAPMLAVRAPMPADPDHWAFEFKWDGVRSLVYHDAAGLVITARRGNAITDRYPELAGLAQSLAGHVVVLDGEIITLDSQGKPSFGLLQQRMHVASSAEARRRSIQTPAVLMIFDLLHLDGRSLLDLPYERRRARLFKLKLAGPHFQTPPHEIAAGPAMLEAARRLNLEGIIAKRLGSLYRPGARSDDWRKIKLLNRQELVIGGWIPLRQAAGNAPGALLVGYYDGPRLRYAGKVGTGFTEESRRQLDKLLQPLRRSTSPFQIKSPRARSIVFVQPELVAEIEFTQWTADGSLRHPSFKGLRTDIDPRRVIREPAPPLDPQSLEEGGPQA